MLTEQERRLATLTSYLGPAVLIEEGWSTEAIAAFIARQDVQDVWKLLKREFDIHEGLRARAKHAALRNMFRMIDPASAVLAQALAGPEYRRDEKGNIVTDPSGKPLLVTAEITPVQLRAAETVLESAGVRDHRIRGDAATDPSLKLLFSVSDERTVSIEDDPEHDTDEQKSLTRERMRIAIEKLAPRLLAARSVVKRGLGLDPATETTVAKVQRKKRRGKKAG